MYVWSRRGQGPLPMKFRLYLSSNRSATSSITFTANSKSSRECPADIQNLNYAAYIHIQLQHTPTRGSTIARPGSGVNDSSGREAHDNHCQATLQAFPEFMKAKSRSMYTICPDSDSKAETHLENAAILQG